MKLCFAIGSLNYSGAENVMSSLLKKFQDCTHDVSVILLNEEDNRKKGKMAIYGCYAKERSKLKRRIKMIKKIYAVMKKEKFDVVISFGFATSTFVLPADKLSKMKCIHCERTNPQYDIRRTVDKMMQKAILPMADGYVFQTREIQKNFPVKTHKEAVVIHNPVRKNIVVKPDYQNKKKIIVTASRLDNRVKNHLILIKAFKNVVTKYPDYEVQIFGDGSDKDLYEKSILNEGLQGKVILCGKTDSTVDAIKDADIFVFTSNYEGMPNSLIEAMSVGLPCITTDFHGGAARELIEDGVNGIIIPVGSQDRLEEELIKLIPDLERKESLGLEAIKINKTHSMEIISAEWMTFIEKLGRIK